MESVHDLTAAYALDALDPAEQREYERHLAACSRCRDELAQLQDTAGALAYLAEAPAPPPQLRERILEQARGERSNVVPLRRQRPFQAAVAVASLAAAACLALGFWLSSLAGELDRERAVSAERAEVLALVSDPRARRIPVSGVEGTLVVAASGKAALVIDALPAAPEGKRYEAWVIDGGDPEPAGLFDSRRGRAEVVLDEPVQAGSSVAVTVEKAAGVEAPTGPPVLSARA